MIETKPTLTKDEQTLVTILRTLPVERIAQILDYARYIQFRAFDDIDLLDEESEEEILADEALWDAQFAATQGKLGALAEKLRAEIRAGRTQEIPSTGISSEAMTNMSANYDKCKCHVSFQT